MQRDVHYTTTTKKEVRSATLRIIDADDKDICYICHSVFKDGDKVAILQCKHLMHIECIKGWTSRGKDTCPVCKVRIPFHEEFIMT